MIFEQISSGGDRNYGYLVGCTETKEAAVIDPSPDPANCYNRSRELGLTVKYIINTHTHYDHTGGNSFFQSKGAKLVTHQKDPIGDMLVKEDDTLEVGKLNLSFIHTPGHTQESMCVLVKNTVSGLTMNLVTGDTLFVGKVGGTYTRKDAESEFDSLKKLMDLDPKTNVWPGHNYGTNPTSTIGNELETNPFIQRLNSFDDFTWLKENWAQYKKENGIS